MFLEDQRTCRRMLKQAASSVLDTREAYLVKRRSFPDSDVSRTTRTACLSILRSAVPEKFFRSLWGRNCCYHPFASVASNLFILSRMFPCPASPYDGQAWWLVTAGRAYEVLHGIHSGPA